jgi:hypothetical protein
VNTAGRSSSTSEEANNHLATLRAIHEDFRARQEKLVDALDAERARLVGLTTSAAFVIGIFVSFRPNRSSALMTALYAAGLLPFVAVMVGLALHGLFAIRVSGEPKLRSWRLRGDWIAARAHELYVPPHRALDANVRHEREWLEKEIARLQGDDWPGLTSLLQLLLLRRRVFELANGALAIEVAWLVIVALVAPFVN